MEPITLCAHTNLLISFEIGYDILFGGSTLNFHIFCLRFGPPIIPLIPNSSVGRTTHKLMTRDTRPSRLLLMTNRIADTYTLIIQFGFQHYQG